MITSPTSPMKKEKSSMSAKEERSIPNLDQIVKFLDENDLIIVHRTGGVASSDPHVHKVMVAAPPGSKYGDKVADLHAQYWRRPKEIVTVSLRIDPWCCGLVTSGGWWYHLSSYRASAGGDIVKNYVQHSSEMLAAFVSQYFNILLGGSYLQTTLNEQQEPIYSMLTRYGWETIKKFTGNYGRPVTILGIQKEYNGWPRSSRPSRLITDNIG